MIDRDRISQDIKILKDKHGSFRSVAKITKINKASLENYFEKTTEPREKNILKLATAMRRDPGYYYSGTALDGIQPPLPTTAYDLLFKALMERLDRQGAILQTTQESVIILQKQLTDITADLGKEIGEIKNKMIDTARSGDIHRLDPTRHFRN